MGRKSQNPEALALRIQRLEDIEAIKQLKARYARTCDPKHNVDSLTSLFTEDAVFDVGERYGRYKGRASIREFLSKADAIIPWAFHYMVSPVIEVSSDGKKGQGSWYLFELAKMPNPKTGELEAVWIAGMYHDEFVKQHGQWRIKRLTLRMEIMSPYADGWAKTPWRHQD